MIHVERESSKQSENLGWISRETFTPSNIRSFSIVARRKKWGGDRRAIVHGYFSQDPAEKGEERGDRKKAKTGDEFGQARKRRTTGWIGTRESANACQRVPSSLSPISLPMLPSPFRLHAFFHPRLSYYSVDIYESSFSRVRLILFSRVRHDRGGRETSPTLLETTPVMKAINASILLREQVWINRDRVIPRLVVIRPGGTESTNSAN